MTYRGLFLADLHIGALPYEQTYIECMHLRTLLEEYRTEGLLDFIILGGDFFDKQLYGNDPYISLALKMMVYILLSAKVVRAVYGTSSHDSEQYQIFDTLAEDIPTAMEAFQYDFKVVTTVTEEELLPGLHVLYLPEEYMFDAGTFYESYFKHQKQYDYVFGHGMIYEAFQGRIKEPDINTKQTRRKAPTFRSGDLARICKGKVYFGHYHVHTEMESGNVIYAGSFSRWMFGEEENKGLLQVFCDLDQEKYWDEFVINDKALKYETVAYGYQDSVFTSSEEMDACVRDILKKKLQRGIDYLRIIFNIPVGYEHAEALMTFFKKAFQENPTIKLEFRNGYIEKRKQEKGSAIKDLPEEMRVLIDKNIPEEDKIQLFLKLKRNIDVPLETIRKHLKLD